MASSTVSTTSRLPKPQLRGHVNSYLRRHLAIATVLSLSGALAWKFLVAEPRKQRYAEFYRNYDLEKEFKRIEKLGLWENPWKGLD